MATTPSGASPQPTGRPRSCECGSCKRCRKRESQRRWYRKQSIATRQALVARRDRATQQAHDRARGYRGDPEKNRVRQQVRRAVARGDLVKEPCLFCDDPNVVAHHHDYGQPLAVTWLCPRHHALADGRHAPVHPF